jgi:magnesium chelatase family protein
MTVKISSIGLKGMEGYQVQVQVKISTATESMVIVGLPDASVKESKERVLAAISHIGVDVTDRKIVVNLSPAEQKKNGPLFDLAMVIAGNWVSGTDKRQNVSCMCGEDRVYKRIFQNEVSKAYTFETPFLFYNYSMNCYYD